MNRIIDNPYTVFFIALIAQWGAAYIGDRLRRRSHRLKRDEQADFDTVLAATLTLLALIIGFSFSMAVSRYDQRKNYEEEEANAIGTEYVRADLMPDAPGAAVRAQLRKYLDLRISFYRTRTDRELKHINVDTAQLQAKMWSAVQTPAVAQPTPVISRAPKPRYLDPAPSMTESDRTNENGSK